MRRSFFHIRSAFLHCCFISLVVLLNQGGLRVCLISLFCGVLWSSRQNGGAGAVEGAQQIVCVHIWFKEISKAVAKAFFNVFDCVNVKDTDVGTVEDRCVRRQFNVMALWSDTYRPASFRSIFSTLKPEESTRSRVCPFI